MDELFGNLRDPAAAAIRAKRVSSEEVVAAHLRWIDQVNPAGPCRRAAAADRALAEARQADAALARGCSGPLPGVPFTAKGHLRRGRDGRRPGAARSGPPSCRMPTTGSWPACEEAARSSSGRRTARPAVPAGTQTTLVYGRTANPYAPSHSPGGSSGGEAAIRRWRLPLGLGSDSEAAYGCPHYSGSRP